MTRARARQAFAAFAAAIALLLPARALADRVALLPASAPASAVGTPAEAAVVRGSAARALAGQGHELVTDDALGRVPGGDGVVDSSGEYRAVATSTHAAWVVRTSVTPLGATYRVEVEAFQAASGRAELLAREIDPARADAMIGEVLALLLRPEGVGTTEPPWTGQAVTPTTPTPAPAPAPAKADAPPPPAAAPPAPTKAAAPPERRAYAEGHPFAAGVSVGATVAAARPSGARGSSFELPLGATLALAFADVPGLELRGDLAYGFVGPRYFVGSAGARYALALERTGTVFLGPEARVGAFVPSGPSGTRLDLHGAAFLAVVLGGQVQLEAAGDADVLPGAGGAVVLLGGSVRALYRF